MRQLTSVGLTLGLLLAMTCQLHAQAPQRDPIVGSYNWHNGRIVVIRDNGTATAQAASDAQGGRWAVNPYGGGGYVIMWEGGYVESLKLKDRSACLEGKGIDSAGNAYQVSGTKRSP